MKAWTLSERKKWELATIEDPADVQDVAKVKVIRAAITSSDIAVYKGLYGKMRRIPSRIAAGLISESPDITLPKGSRVLLAPYSRGNGENVRIRGIHTDGYLSDFSNVPLDCIYGIPEGIADDAIPFIEDIALCVKAYEKLDVNRTEYVVLYGCSTLSLILAQLCLYYQSIPIVVDTDEARLDIADALGVYYRINPSEENPAEKIKEITAGKMAQYLVVDTDTYSVDSEMLEWVTCGGKVGLIGFNTCRSGMRGDFSPIINRDLTVYGITDGIGELETAVNMLATGILRVDSLLDRVVPFEEVPDVFRDLLDKDNAFKTLVQC